MRRDPGIVAPDLAEQRVAADRPTGAVQEFEDRRFLLGQPDLAIPRGIAQQLGPRPKQIGADRQRARLSVSMSHRPARSRASNSPIRIGLTSQSVAPAASPAARSASASGDARTAIGPAIPALRRSRHRSMARRSGSAPSITAAANRPRPRASQRRRGAVACGAGELAIAFELIDETAPAHRIRIDDQHPAAGMHATPNRHSDPGSRTNAHPVPPSLSEPLPQRYRSRRSGSMRSRMRLRRTKRCISAAAT